MYVGYVVRFAGFVSVVLGSRLPPRLPWSTISSPCLSPSACLRRPSLRVVVIMAAASCRRRARGGFGATGH